MLLGIATFSKVTHIVLILPILLLALIRRRYASVFALGATFALVFAALLSWNAFTTGEFNFQGGNRKSFYSRTGFPFANDWETFDNRGQTLATDALPFDILLHRDTATVLLWNLWSSWPADTAGCCHILPRAGGSWIVPGVPCGIASSGSGSRRRDGGAVGLLCYMPYTLLGRRWADREPLFPELLSAVSLPAAAAPQRRSDHCRPGGRRAVHREARIQSFLYVLQPW